MDRHARASAALGLRAPAGYADALARMALYAGIKQTAALLDASVYGANPQALADALAGTSSGSLGERRRLKKEGQRLYRGPGKPAREELAALLKAAAGQLGDWEWARNVEGTADRDAGSLPTVPARSTRSPATSAGATWITSRPTGAGSDTPGPSGCARRRTSPRCRPG